MDCFDHVDHFILINATIFYWKFNSPYATQNKKVTLQTSGKLQEIRSYKFVQLTQWSRIHLEKLIAFQLFKNFSTCFGNTCFITTFVITPYR